jgi:hypothetical protein
MQVQQYQYQYQTNADINNKVYDEAINQKLKLFNRGKCHIWRTNLHMNKNVTQNRRLIQHN